MHHSSSNSATVQILQSPREDERVEVLIEEDAGAKRVVLRHSTWTEGLGWCGQKTLRLESEVLDDLHRAITVARRRINRQPTEASEGSETGKIIRLPSLS